MKADIVIFNLNEISDKATFDNPKQYSVGVKYLIVNGELVIENQKLNRVFPGRLLKAKCSTNIK